MADANKKGVPYSNIAGAILSNTRERASWLKDSRGGGMAERIRQKTARCEVRREEKKRG